MVDKMGIVRTTIDVAPYHDHERRRELGDVMVDTRSAYTWLPRRLLVELGVTPARTERFETADGRLLERDIGFAMVYARGRATATIVVFAGDDDRVLVGAITLAGLNMRVDIARRQLVPSGPVPVAHAPAA